MNRDQLNLISRSPTAYLTFLRRGQLPEGTKPSGPLIELLVQIAPRDRERMRGLRVSRSLGYGGSRVFATAEQAFRWIYPADEVFGDFPADNESFTGRSFSSRNIRTLLAVSTAVAGATYPFINAKSPRLQYSGDAG